MKSLCLILLIFYLFVISIPGLLNQELLMSEDVLANRDVHRVQGVQTLQNQFTIDARSAVLIEPVSGKVLFAQNDHQRLPPASVTKVMTMLLIMEAVDSGRVKWDEPITTSAMAAGMGGSQVYLKEGEEFPLRELFKTIAVVSANDASTAVAEHLYGSVEDFIVAMNQKAQKLGLKNTHFANETGLPDPNHYSSAYDLAIISRELLKHPEILKFTSIWIDTFRGGEFQLRNTNELIKVYRGADGLKTGHTDEAKFCLSATAVKNDFRLLSVILGADSDAKRVAQTRRLLDYGFRNYQWKPLLSAKDKSVGTLYIRDAQPNQIPVRVKQNFGVVVDRGKDPLVETVFRADEKINFPVKAGQKIGEVRAVLNGANLGSTEVYSTVEVKEANFIVRWWRWLVEWVQGWFGKKPPA